MKRANAKGAFEDLRTNEVLFALVGFRLRHVPYPAEVELPRFSAKAILCGETLADWRTGRAHANIVARAQVSGGHLRQQDVLTVSSATD
jgi:hypothetical protein